MKGKKLTIIVLVIVAIIALFMVGGNIVETNKSGFWQVKQAAVSGKMTVRNDPGLYGQLFGDIVTYPFSDSISLSADDLDGGKGADTQPVKVRFQDGSTAHVSLVLRYKKRIDEDSMLAVDKDFSRQPKEFKFQIRQNIIGIVGQTATLFKAEETYATRKAEFKQIMLNQFKEGMYETKVVKETIKEQNGTDKDGNPIYRDVIVESTEIKYDENGRPKILEQSVFDRYNVEILQFDLKDIKYDDTIISFINKKKEAEQAQVVAKANAERAKQDAITAEAQGKAREAEAKAEENVKKITEVTQAEKEAAVAIINAEKDRGVAELKLEEEKLVAEAVLVKGKAEAEQNKLKVAAGLTPQERLEGEIKIQEAWASAMGDAIAEANFPEIVMTGGGSDGSGTDLLDIIGINQVMELKDKVNPGK